MILLSWSYSFAHCCPHSKQVVAYPAAKMNIFLFHTLEESWVTFVIAMCICSIPFWTLVVVGIAQLKSTVKNKTGAKTKDQWSTFHLGKKIYMNNTLTFIHAWMDLLSL